MKKIILFTALLSLFLFPIFSNAAGLVPCGNPGENACTINDFFIMLGKIFNFAITMIVAPLATLMLIIGGVLILISAGNPNLAGLGKKTLYAAIIGIALAFGSWVIINFILGALGYTGNWSVL
ncbi:MAG: hypothetical protein A3G45_00110 [Candidatus Staskawiczbacteria bacterium RIFCSPLOWO2_12_FULL_37_15]|uniref:TrbC/VIRB2 family protein n=1 Tax=Candidatus Staskawiczbacteria bacterium RIFCSPLOWO2_12_FULL_37_15 TaxID=1802218 RepID=A0A1G2IP49_9BACT|nr:MAG: hypothetical protein US35_C0034G0007 [Parcubacteria group bacterium GW2011_GWA2_37_10]OGZ76674.1 MAG: hypothetical protein A3G45_00110 [Candidatus Staskawiczbacteria bacterium RIFCSPLOWO2_12_FULL_37_15]